MLLCISTNVRLWRSRTRGQPKERRRKAAQSERAHREGHVVQAGSVKTFRNAGDSKNVTAGLWTKSNLRGKRRDPWHRANALSKTAADPALSGEDADNSHRRVFTWFVSRWRNHQLKRAEKPHSIIQPPQGPGRPCYEADDSCCHGE